jgi:transposase InsO family protein
MRGVPEHVRSDNGPEFIALAIQKWLGQVGVETLYIAPGAPWENGYAESFHSRLRDEFLALEVFENVAAARKLTTAWKDDYDYHRPHSSLDYLTGPSSRPAAPNPTLITPGITFGVRSVPPRGTTDRKDHVRDRSLRNRIGWT